MSQGNYLKCEKKKKELSDCSGKNIVSLFEVFSGFKIFHPENNSKKTIQGNTFPVTLYRASETQHLKLIISY